MFLSFGRIVGGEGDFKFSGSINNEIGGSVLVSESVSSDDDRLSPSWDVFREVIDEDRFSENGSVEVVSDGSVGGFPHFFEFEFSDSFFIGGDCGAFYSHFALSDSLGGFDSDFIVGFVSVLN